MSFFQTLDLADVIGVAIVLYAVRIVIKSLAHIITGFIELAFYIVAIGITFTILGKGQTVSTTFEYVTPYLSKLPDSAKLFFAAAQAEYNNSK